MTMLDRMRRHKGWLKWSLAIVVLTFILLYVPQFLQTDDVASANDVIATVDGRRITVGVYQQLYLQQVSQIRSQYGEITDQVLRQLGVSQRLIQRLVAQEAALVEAERLGITVSDGELKERLIRLPMFQNNGQFVGEELYRQILSSSRPPLRPAEFEEDLRRSLVSEKLQAAVTGWIRVNDGDVEQEYRRRNEKVKLDVAVFSADKLKGTLQPTEAELAQHFSARQETYRVPEKRRVRYLHLDAEALRSRMTVTNQEVEDRYRESIHTFTTPEQIRASHILFKTEGKDEAAVRKVAESVLAKVKAGGDFAALAKQFSEDDVSKAAGGDLDYFGRGGMVKEFEDAAWTLQAGQTSDLVKTPFGLHIIRLTGRRPATTRSLAEARTQIEDGIKFEKARAEATRLAGDVGSAIKTPADLDRIAKERGLTVGDSGLFSREEPLAGIGFAPAVSDAAFALAQGAVSGALNTNQGVAFIAVTEIKPSYLPKLEEVVAKVREDVSQVKALEVARRRAETLSKATAAAFAGSAKTAGAAVASTDLIARGSVIPTVGVNDRIDAAAFALKPGGVSAPIATDNAVVVVHVKERQEIVPAGLDADRETIRAELTSQRAGAFFEAYMAKARTKMTITYNDSVIQQLIGP
jgi:peptidyl-prolyl cis-trans isomerase D